MGFRGGRKPVRTNSRNPLVPPRGTGSARNRWVSGQVFAVIVVVMVVIGGLTWFGKPQVTNGPHREGRGRRTERP